MARYEIKSSHECGHWVAKRVRGGYSEQRSQAIGLSRDGEWIAGVIYENWNHQSIFCHIAVEGRMTPTYLAAIFDYPFNVCQVEKIIVPIASENQDSMGFVTNLGFTEEARIRKAHPQGDLVFFTLAREACRFLKGKYGQRLSVATCGT